METPEHEQLKLELIDKFDSTKTYLGRCNISKRWS
jgi:hypothetical protein